MTATTIEWATDVWNPVRGCSRISRGCERCYAERQAARFSDEGLPWHRFAERLSPHGGISGGLKLWVPRWTGRVELIEDKLTEPLRWRKPRARVFVNSMSDLFHESLSDDDILRVLAVTAMPECDRHRFLILTKRADRMRDLVSRLAARDDLTWPFAPGCFPLHNVWLGVSVEDQASADARIPELLATPAALRFVSYEPALGPVDFDPTGCDICGGPPTYQSGCQPWCVECDHECGSFRGWLDPGGLDWLIVGGESGPGARPCDVAWIRSVVEQARAASAPCFVKQLGARPMALNDRLEEWPGFEAGTVQVVLDEYLERSRPQQGDPLTLRLRDRKGGDPSEWPEDLRVREVPA